MKGGKLLNQVFTLVLYITGTSMYVKSRRQAACLSAYFLYSGSRPSYMILSSP